jgi:hypothetical protein
MAEITDLSGSPILDMAGNPIFDMGDEPELGSVYNTSIHPVEFSYSIVDVTS